MSGIFTSDAPPVTKILKTWTAAGAQKDINSKLTTFIKFTSKSNRQYTAASTTEEILKASRVDGLLI